MFKAIIFGASNNGKVAYKALREEYKIIAFADNDELKRGQPLFDLPVLKPEILNEYKDIIVIITNKKHYESIKQQLLEIGMERIYFFSIFDFENAVSQGNENEIDNFLYPDMFLNNKIHDKNQTEEIRLSHFSEIQNYLEMIKNKIGEYTKIGEYKKAKSLLREIKILLHVNLDFFIMRAKIESDLHNYGNAKKIIEKGQNLDLSYLDLWSAKYELELKNEDCLDDDLDKTYIQLKLIDRNAKLKHHSIKKVKDKIKVLQVSDSPFVSTIYCQGLNKIGIYAKNAAYCKNYINFPVDYIYSLNSAREEYRQVVANLIADFNMFHFHFGVSLTNDFRDLQMIKEIGKKAIMNYWGSDVRLKSLAGKMLPNLRCKTINEDLVKKNTEKMGKLLNHCIVPDYELYEYVKEFYEKVFVVKQAINTTEIDTIIRKAYPKNTRKIKIIHATTAPEFKGTAAILKTIEELKNEYDFEFKILQKMDHEELLKECQSADIIIDQLTGSYGIFSIENMALGKPVITEISEYMLQYYPRELPLVNANVQNLKEKIIMLMRDKELREEIGGKGRVYVEKNHDYQEIAKELVKVYGQI